MISVTEHSRTSDMHRFLPSLLEMLDLIAAQWQLVSGFLRRPVKFQRLGSQLQPATGNLCTTIVM